MKAMEFICTVRSIQMLTSSVFELVFSTQSPIEFEGGQFVSVIIPGAGPNARDLRRAYSIASPPHQQLIELCVKRVEEGPGTNYLFGLKPSDTFRIMAPYGSFVYELKPHRHACFIATGTGIAPFRSIVLSKKFSENTPLSAFCLLGVRTEAEQLYTEDFLSHANIELRHAFSQPSESWTGFRGRVTDLLRGYKEEFPWLQTEYYLCGHGGMIQEIKAFLLEKGVSKASMHQEIYYK